LEYWTQMQADVRVAGRYTARLEAEGWDGVTVTDSQNIQSDVYVTLAAAALSTTRIRLATGVTNAWTRHPAVTAAAIASLQVLSGGRAELGIGRGDSALAHLGSAPATVARFTAYLAAVQRYLRRDELSLDEAWHFGPGGLEASRRLDHMNLAEEPGVSRLEWLDTKVPKVPVFATASGPKVLRAAAEYADRVALVVGADGDRLRWAIEEVRSVDAHVPLSAYVDVFVGDDVDAAVARGAGRLATHARFSAMHGTVTAPADRPVTEGLRAIVKNYDMTRHGLDTAAHATQVTTEFATRFAIVGPAAMCADRILELEGLGIDRCHIWGYPTDPYSSEPDPFAELVLPLVRGS
jgi:5,10-methylenetetrahydromethanopterin reductase